MQNTYFHMKIEISSTDAVRNFGDCLARIKHRGDTFIITKNRRPVAELTPVTETRPGTLADLLENWKPDPDDPEFSSDLERANSTEKPEPDPWGS